MNKGRSIFALMISILLICTSFNIKTFAVSEGTDVNMEDNGSYKIILPKGYEAGNGQSYPVLYLMPEDGKSVYSDNMISMIQREMETDQSGNMLIVMPNFDSGEDFRITMSNIIADVDTKYNTIATIDQRAILGVGLGGYMAYIYGMTDNNNTVLNTSNTIKNIGSIRGHFSGSDHPLYEEYGDVYDIISQINKDNIVNYYTYLDSPTEDSFTYQPKSTNEIGALFIDWFKTLSYDIHEYTARYGTYDDAYLQESVSRVMNRFSQQFYSKMVNGDISLSPQVAASSIEEIEVGYNIDVNAIFTEISPHPADMTIEVTLTDPADGSVLHKENKTISVAGVETFEGFFKIPNTVNGTNSHVSITAKMLGFTVNVGSESLVRIMDTGSKPDEQIIDLMGDWKFKAYKPFSNTGSEALDQITNVTKDVWSTWGTVQPALGWWSADFDESLENNSNWTGYAWYVREFNINADFAKDDLQLALGKFDEADEVYVNGVRVGATGIPEPGGHYDGSNPWDVDRLYNLDSDILNYGGSNTIAVRMANSNGGGGWYQGPVGIFSPAAYNKIVGLPSDLADSTATAQIKEFVDTQRNALESKDIDAYAKTIAPDYFQSGYNKARLIEKVNKDLTGDGKVTVSDSSVNVYNYRNMYLYQAQRNITNAFGENKTETINAYYKIENGNVVMYGDHETFYVDSYTSSYAASAKGLEGSTEMNYRVYLPEGYFDSNKRYPVTYLLHQFSSTSKSYEIDGIQDILKKGMADGDIQDMIVVIPDSDGMSWWRDDWESMVTEDLVPFINANYRTIADSRYNGTAGASMGGQGAYGIGLSNPNYFSSIISFFGAFTYGREHSPNLIVEQVSDEYLQYYSHYFISGNRDVYGFGAPAIQLDNQLREKNVDHIFMIENGEHDSVFYLPHVIEAFSYVSEEMYTTGGKIADSASGEMEAEVKDNKLNISAKLSLNEEFDQWMNTIPESAYTKNQNPDMVIPVTFKIEQNGKMVFTQVEMSTVSGSTSLEFEKEIILSGSVADQENVVAGDVDPSKNFTLSVFASLLDTNIDLGTFDYTAKIVDEVNPTPDKENPTPGDEPKTPNHEEKPKEDEVVGGKNEDTSKESEADKNKEKVDSTNSNKVEGNNLPNTATNYYNSFLIGSIIVLLGLCLGVLGWRKRLIKE